MILGSDVGSRTAVQFYNSAASPVGSGHDSDGVEGVGEKGENGNPGRAGRTEPGTIGYRRGRRLTVPHGFGSTREARSSGSGQDTPASRARRT